MILLCQYPWTFLFENILEMNILIFDLYRELNICLFVYNQYWYVTL